jgi:hypothetical protein
MNIEFHLIRNRINGLEIGIDSEMLDAAERLPDGGIRLAPQDCEAGEINAWDVIRKADEQYAHQPEETQS